MVGGRGARGAGLIFVYSYDVLDAVQYAIDQNLAPVISMSYGECEKSDTRSDASIDAELGETGDRAGDHLDCRVRRFRRGGLLPIVRRPLRPGQ